MDQLSLIHIAKFSFIGAVCFIAYALKGIFFLQKCGYKKPLFDKAYARIFHRDCIWAAALISLFVAFLLLDREKWILSCLFILMLCVALIRIIKKSKTPCRFTPRVLRLILVTAGLGRLLIFLLFLLVRYVIAPFFSPLGLSALCYAPFLFLFLLPKTAISLALQLLSPIEHRIAQKYVQAAKQVLQEHNQMKRVAIVGSFGKTTVKHLLADLLSVRFRVLTTPASVNTPMGLAKTLNGLKKSDFPEIFIAEMGAKQTGDITELCDMIKPQIGALTAVGSQHLETFGSLHAVYAAKSEICRYMEQTDGVMVFGNDVSLNPVKAQYCGNQTKAALCVQILKEDASGTTVKITFQGRQEAITVPLYGRHVADNLFLALSIAIELGLTFPELLQGLTAVCTVSHRLQLLRLADCTVIDDSYNGNPQGAEEALRVLRLFEGRKVVITPGLIELGDSQQQENDLLGQKIAKAADYVIISAKTNAKALIKGLEKEHFPKEKIVCYRNGVSLKKVIHKVKRSGDVILFLNDLPEIYR